MARNLQLLLRGKHAYRARQPREPVADRSAHRRIVLAVTAIPEEQPPRPAEPSKVIPMESEEYSISDYSNAGSPPTYYDE